MEGLDLDNILDEEEISLFGQDVKQDDTSPDKESIEKDDNDDTTEIDPDSIFEDKSKSVGSEENKENKENTSPDEGLGSSPNSDFFSSIAEALAGEGILPDLDDETIKDIKTPQDLRNVINDYIKSELDEQQRRVSEALNNNVEPDVIRQYEGVLSYLDNITDDEISAETDEGEELRKRIIYQDYINRGFDKSRAEREVNKAFQNGTDVDDAKEALSSNKDFYRNSYKNVLNEAKQQRAQEEEETKKRAVKLRDDVLDEKYKFFDDLDVDKKTRQKIYDNITKPIYKDKKTGEMYTAIQKYELEHRDEFLKKLGLIYTLTDGFENLDGLVKNKVKKEVKKGFKDLERKINNTSVDMYGNLKYVSNIGGDGYIGKNLKLDI